MDETTKQARLLVMCLEKLQQLELVQPTVFFDDFFQPDFIMERLKDEPMTRGKILVANVGLPKKTAHGLPAKEAGAIIALAYRSKDVTAEDILKVYTAEDRVRTLHWPVLTKFLLHNEWWLDDKKTKAAAEMTTFIIGTALDLGCLTAETLRDQISTNRLAEATIVGNPMLARQLLSTALDFAALGDILPAKEIFNIVEIGALVQNPFFKRDFWHQEVIEPLTKASGWVEATATGTIKPEAAVPPPPVAPPPAALVPAAPSSARVSGAALMGALKTKVLPGLATTAAAGPTISTPDEEWGAGGEPPPKE